MSDLTYTGKNPKIESVSFDHTIVMSASNSLVLVCTLCGGFKTVLNYVIPDKQVSLNTAHTCTCNYAVNPGGDYYNFDHADLELKRERARVLNDLGREQARVLVALWPCDDIEDLRTRLQDIDDTRYTPDFKTLVANLYMTDSLEDVQRLILAYAASHEVKGYHEV